MCFITKRNKKVNNWVTRVKVVRLGYLSGIGIVIQ